MWWALPAGLSLYCIEIPWGGRGTSSSSRNSILHTGILYSRGDSKGRKVIKKDRKFQTTGMVLKEKPHEIRWYN